MIELFHLVKLIFCPSLKYTLQINVQCFNVLGLTIVADKNYVTLLDIVPAQPNIYINFVSGSGVDGEETTSCLRTRSSSDMQSCITFKLCILLLDQVYSAVKLLADADLHLNWNCKIK